MAISCLHGDKIRGAKIAARVRALAVVGAMLAALAAPALAEHTRWWRQETFEDFDKGTPKGVALRSDGKLFLAPRFAEFADVNLAYLLALRADGKGNLYAAGGSNAKVLRLDAAGKATSVFESQELAAQALAIDSSGNLFVGTSPDGKVYKVTPGGQSSVFFDPKTKYIWDLAVDKDGTVYVATGDTGKIFVVAPDGKGQVFYSSGETHIRSLALDAKGNVLAGTEPSGRVLRIAKGANPRAFVLYETSKREITALLEDAAGNLYVSAVGEKTAAAPLPVRPQVTETQPAQNFTMTVVPAGTAAGAVPLAQPGGFTPFPAVNSSSVYKISADGSPDELWNSRDQVVYALALLPNGKLIFGTGNDGAVVELEGNHIYSRVVKAASHQITSIAPGPGGKMFLAAANPGKVFALDRTTNRKERLNRSRSTLIIFPVLEECNGGAKMPPPARARAARGSNSSRARETLPIRRATGARGAARTRIWARTRSIARRRGSCSGKRRCMEAPRVLLRRSIGSAWHTCRKMWLRT